jgi:hypothetical protein
LAEKLTARTKAVDGVFVASFRHCSWRMMTSSKTGQSPQRTSDLRVLVLRQKREIRAMTDISEMIVVAPAKDGERIDRLAGNAIVKVERAVRELPQELDESWFSPLLRC